MTNDFNVKQDTVADHEMHVPECNKKEPRIVHSLALLVFGDCDVIIAEETCNAYDQLVMQHGEPTLETVELDTGLDLNDSTAVAIVTNRHAVAMRKLAQERRITKFCDRLSPPAQVVVSCAKDALEFGQAVAGTPEISPECYAYADIYMRALSAVSGEDK